MDFAGVDTFGTQIVGGVAFGGEQEVGDLVGEDAVDLFGHAPVTAAKACLDVRDLNASLDRDERTAQRRVDVADDEHHIGGMVVERLVERSHDAGRLHGVARGADFEMKVGFGNLEVAEELGGHVVVVVLSGVDQPHADFRGIPRRVNDRGDFHEVRPGARDDGEAEFTGQIAASSRRQKSSN